MSIASWQLASRAKSKWRLSEDIAEACFCLRSFQLSQSSQDHTLFKNFQPLHNRELLNDTCRRINFNCTELSNILCVSFTTPSDHGDQKAFWSERVADCKWMTTRQFFLCFLIQASDRRKKEFARLSPRTSRPCERKARVFGSFLCLLLTTSNVLPLRCWLYTRAQRSAHFTLQIAIQNPQTSKTIDTFRLFAWRHRETLNSNSSHTAESSLLLLQKMQIS